MDSGDLFFPPGSTPQSLVGQEKQIFDPKIDLYIKSYKEMKYDGFTPGEIDLSLGVQELLKRSRQAQFPFLSANLIERQSKKPVFAPYRIKDAGEMKIGIFGLISNNFHLRQSTGDREKYFLAEPLPVAGKTVSQLKAKGCDVIICLAHMEENEQKILAQEVRGIHFILGGHARTLRPETNQVNNTDILKAGTRGEYLGQVEFFTSGKRLYSHYEVISLDKKHTDQLAVARMIEEYKTRLRALLSESERAAFEQVHDCRPGL